MELLLNLAWVLMALPSYWLWRQCAGARALRSVSALQCLLALGCVLVLLFPVISATDDLHAMRTEMEESSTSKRAVRQTGGDKQSAWVNRLQGPPALGGAYRLAARSASWTAGSSCFMFANSGQALRFACRARSSAFPPRLVRRIILIESSFAESLIGSSNNSAALVSHL